MPTLITMGFKGNHKNVGKSDHNVHESHNTPDLDNS